MSAPDGNTADAKAAESDAAATYKAAGVDIDAGNALVKRIAPLIAATRRPGADGTVGGFGGLFDLKAAGYADPLLVAGTDGVGTKLKLAIETGLHDTVGIDLVAMVVNDLAVQGAEPLFFLDYVATGALSVDVMADVIGGIATGCAAAGCALIGGETAEMPGMYADGHYDLAGFAVGAVERAALLPRLDAVAPGDVLIGLASSGLHSNGYSLVRKIVADRTLGWDAPAPFAPDTTLGAALLTPTRIYVAAARAMIAAGGVKAFSHITGGGLIENLPRVLPARTVAAVDGTKWTLPPVFDWLRSAGNVAADEMARVFNCGIGFITVVDPAHADAVLAAAAEAGETATPIGRIESGSGDPVCTVTGL